MNGPDLRIGAVVIPDEGRVKVTQTYRRLGAIEDQRTAAGGGVRWVRWDGKLETVISLMGWIPPGLAALDVAAPVVVSCAAPRAVDSNSPVIDIPAARRAGGIYDPRGFAEVGGYMLETPLVMAGDQATLTQVLNADRYRVQYYPEFSAHVTLSDEILSGAQAEYTAGLTASQV